MIKGLVFLTALLLATPGSAEIDLTQSPEDIVASVADELFVRLESNRELYDSDEDELAALVRSVFSPVLDEQRSARLILGRHARSLSDEQIDEFADALADQLIREYADGLGDFASRDQVQILKSRGGGSERARRVRTTVELSSGQVAPTDYVFHKTDDGWRVFDVVIEGISYVTTYRNQIGDQISREGFDAALQKLKAGEIEV